MNWAELRRLVEERLRESPVGGKRIGIEIKYADAPRVTRSMHVALEDLKLDRLFVVAPSGEPYPLGERVEVRPLPHLLEWLDEHA